jgi:hypothetical protein
VFPVQQRCGISHHTCYVDVCVFDTDTPMWPSSEDHVVLWVHVRLAHRIQPTVGEKQMWILVDGRIMKRWVQRGNDHAVSRDRVEWRDWECLGSLVWDLAANHQSRLLSVISRVTYHRNRRLESQAFFDNGSQVRHVINLLQRHRFRIVPIPDSLLFLPDLCQNIGMVR